MFVDAVSFNQPLNKWNVSIVTRQRGGKGPKGPKGPSNPLGWMLVFCVRIEVVNSVS